MIRRTAARLLVLGLATLMLAAPGPASASPSVTGQTTAATHAALATTCSITFIGWSYAHGACQNPDPDLVFRVRAWCRDADTGRSFPTASVYESTFDTATARCFPGDMISSPTTQIAPAPQPPPVIHSLTCQSAGFGKLTCSLSASGWTHIRWTINGNAVPWWDNSTSIHANCVTGQPSALIEFKDIPVRVAVSNSDGTTNRQTSVGCVVTG